MLTFDAEKHVYTFGDRVVPSVTQVLNEWRCYPRHGYYINNLDGMMVRASIFETGADHGKAVHLGCSILFGGHDLNWDVLDSDLINPLREFERWFADWSPVIELTEHPMYSPKFGYAGTPDIVARIQKKMAIVDIKSGAYGMAGPQTSAYEQLYKESEKYRGTVKRYVLHLPKTGPYKFIPQTDKQDWDFFRSRLFQYQYLQGR